MTVYLPPHPKKAILPKPASYRDWWWLADICKAMHGTMSLEQLCTVLRDNLGISPKIYILAYYIWGELSGRLNVGSRGTSTMPCHKTHRVHGIHSPVLGILVHESLAACRPFVTNDTESLCFGKPSRIRARTHCGKPNFGVVWMFESQTR